MDHVGVSQEHQMMPWYWWAWVQHGETGRWAACLNGWCLLPITHESNAWPYSLRQPSCI